MKIFQFLLLGLLPLFLGCVSTTNSGAVGADRTQIFLVSEEDMLANANANYVATLTNAKATKSLNTNKKQTEKVQDIAKRLIDQTPVFRENAKDWAWEVNVINSNELNAWCMPGGKIAVYTGLVNTLDNDAQLAAVIGHEIAHALREHQRERASQDHMKNIGVTVLALATKMNKTQAGLVEKATNFAFNMPFSRVHENEADKMGIELMARAGYDPYEAPIVWQKMSEMTNDKTPEFLSTHPSHKTRIKETTKYAEIVYPLYVEAKQKIDEAAKNAKKTSGKKKKKKAKK